MTRVKTVLTMLAGIVLAGCAASSQGLREADLRNDNYYRGDYLIGAMTFPKLQMALFKHEAACGTAPVFKMDERQTGYATLWLYGDDPTNLRDAVMVDVTALQGSMFAEERVLGKIYTYYNTEEVKQRVRTVRAAIERPGECGDAAAS